MSSKSSRSGGTHGSSSKAVDESNMKTLRDLSHLSANRHCFECGQRGPTYVDVTTGSFVCMTCSGLLRGITPPHRVKSISMASFTPEEIELLKNRGNEYCRKVWLATHTSRDSTILFASGTNEDDRRTALKAHLSSKYEQKRWYLDPSKIPELADIQAQNQKALVGSSDGNSNSTRSPSLSSTSSASSLSLSFPSQNTNQNSSPVMNNLRSNSNGRIPSSHTLPDIKPLSTLLSNPPNFINNLKEEDRNKIINTNMKADPWANANGGVNGEMPGFNANFANFDQAFNSSDNGNNGGNSFNFDPFGDNTQAKNNLNSGGGFIANFDKTPLMPNHNSNANNNLLNGSASATSTISSGSEDKYAALKDLDDLFKQDSSSPPSGSSGLTSSISMPTNLSSNGWAVANGNQGGMPNPFSIVGGTSPPGGVGAGASSSVGVGSWGPSNPHNPFASTGIPSSTASIWPSSSPSPSNGNNGVSSTSSTGFGNSSGFPTMVGGATNNPGGFPATAFGSSPKPQPQMPMFNPFTATTAPASNPHNPFLF